MNTPHVSHFPEIFNTLLTSLGLSESEIGDFLSPDYNKLHDPLLLPNMEQARDRVISAIEQDEHIVVFGDYDADGIPGSVVLADLFERIGYKNVSFYIPHRHDEGFGLNLEAVEECAGRGAKLMITVDCGINGVEEVERAHKLGMEVIITDHHEPGASIPQAYAIVNPKLPGSQYPFPELCGAAVAYKLVQAVLQKNNFGTKDGMEKWSLDMVGIATLSDMVPLVGENRILAKFGLDVLRKSRRPGLLALLKRLKIDQRFLNEDDIGFMITPRINAASRMGVSMDAFKLLSTRDEVEADMLAKHLEEINNQRKISVAHIVKEAKKSLSMRSDLRSVIVVGNPEWRPALAGLVANSLVEEYERPAFVWGRDGEGVIKGSCRTPEGYDLHSLMSGAGDTLLEFGGHSGAGGFSVSLENLSTLEEKLSEALLNQQHGTRAVTDAVSTIQIGVDDIREELWQTVSLFAPFGMKNDKPVFEIRGNLKDMRQFGKEDNHLEVEIAGGDRSVKAISFFSTPESFNAILMEGAPVTLLAHLEKSYFRNRPELRLRIVDIMSA